MSAEKDRHRDGRLEFENGYVTIDFDTYKLIMHYAPTNMDYSIGLKAEYASPDKKYAVQLDMAERCFNDNIPPFTIDGVDLQIDALEWLMEQRKK